MLELSLQPAAPPQPGKNRKPWLWAAALIGLVLAASAAIGIARWNESRALKATIEPIFATAKLQAERGEYESAFWTYQGLLKTDSANRQAMDLQVDSAMGWLENFHAVDAGIPTA